MIGQDKLLSDAAIVFTFPLWRSRISWQLHTLRFLRGGSAPPFRYYREYFIASPKDHTCADIPGAPIARLDGVMAKSRDRVLPKQDVYTKETGIAHQARNLCVDGAPGRGRVVAGNCCQSMRGSL